MGLNSVKFSCTALAGSNKAGILKKDDKGYYECVVGALNVFNSAGQYYVYEQAKELFQSSSQLMRRVSRGVLRGELGHPKFQPGMSQEQFANRVMSIYEENVCCHHKELSLNFEDIKDSSGKPIIAIISKVLPAGPHGASLEKSLNNPDENVCFSIRAFTDDYREGSITKRILKNVVTFDNVNEPGISIAEKYQAPSLENLSDITFLRGELERCAKNESIHGMASESVILGVNDLFKAMNWVGAPAKPIYLDW